MKLKDKISCVFRTLKEVHDIQPGLWTIIIFRMIFDTAPTYIEIYFSARVLDLLFSGAGFAEMLKTALTGSVISFVTLAASRVLRKYDDLYYYSFFQTKADLKKAEKSMSMSYETVESPEIHNLKQKIENLQMMGQGFYQQCYYIRGLLSSLISVVYSIILCIGLFGGKVKLDGTFSTFICSVWASLIVIAFIIISMIIISKFSNDKKKLLIGDFGKTAIMQFFRRFSYYADVCSNYKFGKDIRIYDMKSIIHKEGIDNLGTFNNSLNEIAKKVRKPIILGILTENISTVVFFIFVGLRSMFGMFGVGSVVQYIRSLSKLFGNVAKLAESFTQVIVRTEGPQLYFEYMDTPNNMIKGTIPVEKRAFCDGGDNEYDIEFRNVSFRYPGTETDVLKNVNFKFKIGERLAVVGMNGSGKTTMIKLMCRLYDPTEGEILLNGIDIRKYDYTDYMSIFSVVFQDFKLFAFGLGENVASSRTYDREKAERCLCEAGLGDRIKELPRGLDTYLYRNFEFDGVEISGGEAQKIALARALYKDAPFIILDEPTAALDPIAEAEVYSKFNDIVGNKTAIYISHRLSSCRFCDKIAVFDNGQIVQVGTHDSLVADEKGKYHELWYAQAQYYA